MVIQMGRKYVCIAKRCAWRVDCGPHNAVCSRQNCPNIRILEKELPDVRWGNLTKKKK